MSALLDELKDVATKIAGYAEEDLQKLAAFLFNENKSNVGLTTDGNPVPLAMQTPQEYLASLTPEAFDIVSGYITRDQFGIAHPNVSTGCVPPCSGPGRTANGHWECDGGSCIWIPEIG